MFLSEAQMRARARRRARSEGGSVDESLARASRLAASRYDIFLSQTIRDAEIVLGVYDFLTEMKFVVFCDWIACPETDRSAVTPANAEAIRAAMAISDTLLFIDSEKADQSLWMCWELGWFDGAKGHVGILPVLPEGKDSYRGREFLGLYPYVEIDGEGHLKVVRPPATNSHGVTLFEAPNARAFGDWRARPGDFMRPRIIEHLRAF